MIRTIQERGNGTYGSWFMVILVNRETGGAYGRRRITRIMREQHLQARIRRRKHPTRYYERKREAMGNLPDNLLDREFTAERPLQKLVTDIPYIPTSSGWCFSCPVMDLYNREIVTFVLFQSIQLELPKQLLEGLGSLELEDHALLHSDRGATFCAATYRKGLKRLGIVQSMSRSGNCWDNACMESFFGHMKDELDLRRQRGKSVLTYAKIKTLLAEWIEEYNTIRPHSTLQGFSPIEYRLMMNEKDKNRLQ